MLARREFAALWDQFSMWMKTCGLTGRIFSIRFDQHTVNRCFQLLPFWHCPIGYTDAFRSLHVGEIGHFTFGITFGKRSKTIEAYESITSYYLQRWLIDWKAAKSIRDLAVRESRLTTPP